MHFSFSRKWGLIDFKVWLSFIAVAVLCIGLLSYKIATAVDCPETTLTARGKLNHTNEKGNTFYISEQLDFTAGFDAGKHKIVWDFGDKSETQAGNSVSHTYMSAGTFLVTATIDGACRESFNVYITDGLSASQGAPSISPIVSADIMNIGDENIFNTTLSADTYTWGVEELPQMEKVTTPTAKFIFPKAGNYTVTLLLGDGRSFKKMIQVLDPAANMASTAALPPATTLDPIGPPPPPLETQTPISKKEDPVIEEKKDVPEPPAKTYEQLPLPAIQAMLEEVIEGKKDVADFNNQLCNSAGTKVVANDHPTTFAALCLELKKKKRKMILFKKEKSITSVKVVRDEANGNCISLLYVNYK